jgi:hypothetical protein
MFLDTKEEVIDVLTDKKILVYFLSGMRVIVVVTLLSRRYFILPSFVTVIRDDVKVRFLLSFGIDSELKNNFIASVDLWAKGINGFYRNKLILKGLGFKVGLFKRKSLLVLKLGYSRSLQVAFSAYKLRVKVSKNVITIQGQNFSEVGDFTRRVSRLRVPDAYKGKGFWYKDEVRSLKELKKK